MRQSLLKVALGSLVMLAPGLALACPFCGTVQNTMSEQLEGVHAAVVAKFASLEPISAGDGKTAEASQGRFTIVEVLKGADLVKGQKTVETLYFGEPAPDRLFYIVAMDPPNLQWGTPLPITERVHEHLKKLPTLPKEGAARLAYFQDLFEHSDVLLANDAYDEFAKSPYDSVKALKDQMHHDRLLAWAQDEKVSVSHRRLYLTMLGVCGQSDDVPVLEKMIQHTEGKYRAGLDALVACYVCLKGPDGLDLVDEVFFRNKSSEYADTYAAVMALRFHGTEAQIVSRERLLQSFRLLLDRPAIADLIIPDLARWEDWSVLDKMVTLFKEATEKNNWVRVPVINYLRTCPLPEAKEKLAELEKLDPKAVKRANFFFAPLQDGGAPEKAPEGKPKTSLNDRDAAPVQQSFAAPIPPPDEDEAETKTIAALAAAVPAAGASLPAARLAAAGHSENPPGSPDFASRVGVSLAAGALVTALAWALGRKPRGVRAATP